ncbi:MAG: hypothetical protein AAGF07_02980 [Patescibacteria group bacterium]
MNSPIRENPNKLETEIRKDLLGSGLELSLEEAELLKNNYTNVAARIDFQKGTQDLISKIKSMCVAENSGKGLNKILFKLKNSFSQNYKSIEASVKNYTLGEDLISVFRGNRESYRSQLSCYDSYQVCQELIRDLAADDLKKIQNTDELKLIEQEILQFKRNWINFARKVDLEEKNSQQVNSEGVKADRTNQDAARKVKVDYHRSGLETNNVWLKHGSRVVTGLAAAAGFAIGDLPNPFADGRGVLSGTTKGLFNYYLGEKKIVDQKEEEILRNSLKEVGVNIVSVLNGPASQEVSQVLGMLSLLETLVNANDFKIQSDVYNYLNQFLTKTIAKYSHKFEGDVDDSLINLGVLMYQLKGKVETQENQMSPDSREINNILVDQCNALARVGDRITDVASKQKNKEFRTQAKEEAKEGRNARLLKNLGMTLGAVAGGWGLRKLTNGVIEIMQDSGSPDISNLSSNAVKQSEDLLKKGANPFIQESIEKGSDIGLYNGKLTNMELEKILDSANPKININEALDSLYNDDNNMVVAQSSADLQKAFNISAPNNSDLDTAMDKLIEKDYNLQVADTNNAFGKITNLADSEAELPKSSNSELKLGNVSSNSIDKVSDKVEVSVNRSSTTSNIAEAVGETTKSTETVDYMTNYLGPLGGAGKFKTNFQEGMVDWLKGIPGDNGKSLSELYSGLDYDQMGDNITKSFEKAFNENKDAFKYNGESIDSFEDIKDFSKITVKDKVGAANVTKALSDAVAEEIKGGIPTWNSNSETVDNWINDVMGGEHYEPPKPIENSTIPENPDMLTKASLGGIPGALVGASAGGLVGGVSGYHNTQEGQSRARNFAKGAGLGILSGATGGAFTGASLGAAGINSMSAGLWGMVGGAGLSYATRNKIENKQSKSPEKQEVSNSLQKIASFANMIENDIQTYEQQGTPPNIEALNHVLQDTNENIALLDRLAEDRNVDPDQVASYRRRLTEISQKLTSIKEILENSTNQENIENSNNLNNSGELDTEISSKLSEVNNNLENMEQENELEKIQESIRYLNFAEADVNKYLNLTNHSKQANLDELKKEIIRVRNVLATKYITLLSNNDPEKSDDSDSSPDPEPKSEKEEIVRDLNIRITKLKELINDNRGKPFLIEKKDKIKNTLLYNRNEIISFEEDDSISIEQRERNLENKKWLTNELVDFKVESELKKVLDSLNDDPKELSDREFNDRIKTARSLLFDIEEYKDDIVNDDEYKGTYDKLDEDYKSISELLSKFKKQRSA